MILAILLAISGVAFGQSTGTYSNDSFEEEFKIQNLGKGLRELESGRPTITGLPTFKNGVKFNDSTTQTTAYNAAVSSCTATPFSPTSGTGAGFQVAVATLTITTTGGRVRMYFSGSVTGSASQTICGFNVIQDGAFISPWTAALGMTRGYTGTGGAGLVMVSGFSTVTPTAPSAASHTYGLQMNADGTNTCSIVGGTLATVSQFCVEEIH